MKVLRKGKLALFLIYWAAISTVHCLAVGNSSADAVNVEAEALGNFKVSQTGTGLSSWRGGDPCNGRWRGIQCSPLRSGNISRQVVTRLQLASVELKGSITDLSSLRNLTTLILVDCKLQGGIPASLGKIHTLQYIFLDNNDLTGPIPEAVGALPNLIAFSATKNNLSGPVPASFGMQSSLIQLLLTNNSLNGPAPPSLQNLTILALDPSVCTPWHDPTCLVVPNTTAVPGVNTTALANGTTTNRNGSSSGGVSMPLIIVILAVGALLSVGAVLLVLLYFLSTRQRDATSGAFTSPSWLFPWKKRSGSDKFRWAPPRLDLGGVHAHVKQGMGQVFTYKELQGATDNFSPVNIVGEGGFGSVYRGTLADGRLAAIKRLDRSGRQGDKEFRVEVDMLTRLGSPFLVDLMGYCADNDQRILVYEYMHSGSLQDHLYTDGHYGSPPLLDWPTRLRIALDAARGLEYLHEYATPPVIHRDFKSSNVLLDENYNAKVSDFGLAKLGTESGGYVSTRVLGTQGYVAPEYALTGHLTTKSDVYSYGIVLLELLTGRLPLDSKRSFGETVLVTWALPMLTDKARLEKIVDPVIVGQFNVKDLSQVAAIAAMCVQPEAEYRPLMTDIVQSLIPLVKNNTQSTVVEDYGPSGMRIVMTRAPEGPPAATEGASEMR